MIGTNAMLGLSSLFNAEEQEVEITIHDITYVVDIERITSQVSYRSSLFVGDKNLNATSRVHVCVEMIDDEDIIRETILSQSLYCYDVCTILAAIGSILNKMLRPLMSGPMSLVEEVGLIQGRVDSTKIFLSEINTGMEVVVGTTDNNVDWSYVSEKHLYAGMNPSVVRSHRHKCQELDPMIHRYYQIVGNLFRGLLMEHDHWDYSCMVGFRRDSKHSFGISVDICPNDEFFDSNLDVITDMMENEDFSVFNKDWLPNEPIEFYRIPIDFALYDCPRHRLWTVKDGRQL